MISSSCKLHWPTKWILSSLSAQSTWPLLELSTCNMSLFTHGVWNIVLYWPLFTLQGFLIHIFIINGFSYPFILLLKQKQKFLMFHKILEHYSPPLPNVAFPQATCKDITIVFPLPLTVAYTYDELPWRMRWCINIESPYCSSQVM